MKSRYFVALLPSGPHVLEIRFITPPGYFSSYRAGITPFEGGKDTEICVSMRYDSAFEGAKRYVEEDLGGQVIDGPTLVARLAQANPADCGTVGGYSEPGYPAPVNLAPKPPGREGFQDGVDHEPDEPLSQLRRFKMGALREWAVELAEDYNSPVYLCGSALHKQEPRDWDVRITLTDKQFEERYGGAVEEWMAGLETGQWTDANHRQSDDNVAKTKQGWAKVGLNIDMQVYPQSYAAKYDGLPRLLLAPKDTLPR